MEIPETLKLTEEEKKNLLGKSAYIGKPNNGMRVVQFLSQPLYGMEPINGGYDQILQYLMSLHPSQPNCCQVEKHLSSRHAPQLIAYTQPRYVGDNVDEVAALLTRYKRVRVVDETVRLHLRGQFPFLEFDRERVSMISQTVKKRTLKLRADARVRKGLVPWNTVSCLYWSLERRISDLARGYLEVRGWCWPRDVAGYMDRIPKTDAFAEKLGLRLPLTELRPLKIYLPGLLRHQKEEYRGFGKWLKKKLKSKKR